LAALFLAQPIAIVNVRQRMAEAEQAVENRSCHHRIAEYVARLVVGKLEEQRGGVELVAYNG
jgi:hypothetical protein